MSWRDLILGAIAGGLITGLWLINKPKPDWDKQIMLPGQEFYAAKEDGQIPTYVHVVGTIAGEHLGYPNNTVTIDCDKSAMTCNYAMIEEIGDNQMGSIQIAQFAVSEWNRSYVIAADTDASDPISCAINTVSIDLNSERASYISQPLNVTKPLCAKADNQTFKRTIDPSPGQKALTAALKNSAR